MRTRGFTFIEVLIVMVLIGIIAALGIPRIRDAIQKNNVRSARAAIGTLVAKARGAAVQRGCKSAIHFTQGTAGKIWVANRHDDTRAADRPYVEFAINSAWAKHLNATPPGHNGPVASAVGKN